MTRKPAPAVRADFAVAGLVNFVWGQLYWDGSRWTLDPTWTTRENAQAQASALRDKGHESAHLINRAEFSSLEVR